MVKVLNKQLLQRLEAVWTSGRAEADDASTLLPDNVVIGKGASKQWVRERDAQQQYCDVIAQNTPNALLYTVLNDDEEYARTLIQIAASNGGHSNFRRMEHDGITITLPSAQQLGQSIIDSIARYESKNNIDHLVSPRLTFSDKDVVLGLSEIHTPRFSPKTHEFVHEYVLSKNQLEAAFETTSLSNPTAIGQYRRQLAATVVSKFQSANEGSRFHYTNRLKKIPVRLATGEEVVEYIICLWSEAKRKRKKTERKPAPPPPESNVRLQGGYNPEKHIRTGTSGMIGTADREYRQFVSENRSSYQDAVTLADKERVVETVRNEMFRRGYLFVKLVEFTGNKSEPVYDHVRNHLEIKKFIRGSLSPEKASRKLTGTDFAANYVGCIKAIVDHRKKFPKSKIIFCTRVSFANKDTKEFLSHVSSACTLLHEWMESVGTFTPNERHVKTIELAEQVIAKLSGVFSIDSSLEGAIFLRYVGSEAVNTECPWLALNARSVLMYVKLALYKKNYNSKPDQSSSTLLKNDDELVKLISQSQAPDPEFSDGDDDLDENEDEDEEDAKPAAKKQRAASTAASKKTQAAATAGAASKKTPASTAASKKTPM